MRLPGWARQVRVPPRAACRGFHAGQLAVAAQRLAMGTVLVAPLAWGVGEVAVCARVSWTGQGRRVVVVDDGEVADDLVGGMPEVVTSMCARLYGRRSARRRAQRAVAAAGGVGA